MSRAPQHIPDRNATKDTSERDHKEGVEHVERHLGDTVDHHAILVHAIRVNNRDN
jgi:hypothetical protein